MVVESDKATEARRKALRNGEEDPIVVAQRFLNIYRQMHIFSPERKEAFDKMLMELAPDIRGIFATLPGGAMLQDYVDDLAEKAGLQKAVYNAPEVHLNEEAHQQAQILATALAKAQSQTAAPVAATAGAPAKLAIDKDFAGEFAKIMGNLLQEQSAMQKEGLSKLATDLSKTQLYIAKSMKESKEEQRQEIGELCKTIAQGYQTSRQEQRQEIGELCKTIAEGYHSSREEQRQQIGELCKTIAQSQTALSSSLSSISREASSAVQAPAAPAALPAYDDTATRQLIEVVLDGQKQINSRLDRVEELTLSKANDNRQLLAAFEKSQAEMIKSLSNLNQGSPLPIITSTNDEKLAQLIGESQEKLIKTLLSANFQQNNTAQSNNNANNIQINTPDNSAQMLLLVDKISSLQASNEQNLEKAITQAIEAQGRLYDKISRQQTKELAEIIADSLKEIARPVYVVPQADAAQPQPAPAPVAQNFQSYPQAEEFEEVYADPAINEPPVNQASRIPPDLEGEEINFDIFSPLDNEAAAATEKTLLEDMETNNEIQAEIPFEETAAEEGDTVAEPLKKKRKRKKKKKKNLEGGSIAPDAESDIFLPSDEDFELASLPASQDIIDDQIDFSLKETDSQSETLMPAAEEAIVDVEPEPLPASQLVEEAIDIQQNNIEDQTAYPENGFEAEPQADISGDDWGFGAIETKEASGSNDNQEEQDWEWAYVEEEPDMAVVADDEPVVEAIGQNSYIYSSDLFSQEKVTDNQPIIYAPTPLEVKAQPLIFDNVADEEFVDPYQNSILKD